MKNDAQKTVLYFAPTIKIWVNINQENVHI